jgi:hypothetical protein
MIREARLCFSLLAVIVGLALTCPSARAENLALNPRRLIASEQSAGQWQQVTNRVSWESSATAVVICDMWDKHWCKGASARVAEMAPRMNEVVAELRRKGVLIIHCPSDTMKFYEGTPGRKLAQSAPPAAVKVPMKGWCSLDSVKEPALPIDDSDGGCDDSSQCAQGSPWRRQIATLEIMPGDAVTDSSEAYNLMHQRGITNVIIMVYQGQNVLLVRDLTDSMYNSRRAPRVDHFTGNDLMAWHIEKYWCPTITSDQIVGGQPFRFAADTRPPRVFGASVSSPPNNRPYRHGRSSLGLR